MSRRFTSLAGLLILLVLFFAVNILAAAMLRSTRLDLTQEKLFTLTEGSRNIAKAIDEPIRLYLYFSRSLATGRPSLQQYGQRVQELLEEYVRIAGGKIVLEVIDPEPFSEAEDQAVQAGVVGVPLGGGQGSLYFGLLGTNALDGREVIPFLDPGQEQFLEYEISRMIYSLTNPARKVVGVISSLPIDGGPPNPALGQMQPQRPWLIMDEIRRLFDVRVLGPGEVKEIPEDIDVLLVVHPKELPVQTEYAIDQFVLGGGNAIIFVDPLCESDIPPQMMQNPMAALQVRRNSDLPTLFSAWGLTLEPGKVACDRTYAQQVISQASGRREPVSYVGWLALDGEAMDRDDAVTGRLGTINLATAGALQDQTQDGTTWTPLLVTSTDSMLIDADRFALMADPKTLLNDFLASGEQFTLAGRLSGTLDTAFPDGPPEAKGTEEKPDEEGGAAHRSESVGPVSVIVVADVDMLTDRFWVREETLFGQIRLGNRKIADNGDFLINALDNMAGSNDLISVRARGQANRPFELVDSIRRDSEQRYLAEEKQLQDRLQETEQKLNDLQRQRPDQGQLILTAEQQAEVERFNQERIETRKQLRNVQLNLRKDIESLGTRLKVINIGLMPLILAVLAIGVGLYRMHRRKDVGGRRE